MKNRLVKAFSIVLSVFVCLVMFTGCKQKSKIIDNSVYFDDVANYSTFNSSTKKTASLRGLIVGEGATSFQYTSIDVLGNLEWIGGMYIESVSYTFVATAPTTLELDFTIANVKSTTNFNSVDDYYYYLAETSLEIGESKKGTYTFLVNDYISDTKAPQFLLNIDSLCYQTDNSLTLKLAKFEVKGYHIV